MSRYADSPDRDLQATRDVMERARSSKGYMDRAQDQDGASRGDGDRHARHHRHRGEDRDRRRSRSPAHKRRRSESPRDSKSERRHREDKRSHHSHRHREKQTTSAPLLPFSARQLSKNDLPSFEPLLADFLYIQKQKDLYEMDDREVKGRWKSFVGKWNRGELAEGWYDPETFQRVQKRAEEMGLVRLPKTDEGKERGVVEDDREEGIRVERRSDGEDEDGDDYGPVLPGTGSGKASGPGIPSRQDLALRDEQRLEDRATSIADLRHARALDRTLQKERLEDLTPRAPAGTRERQLEKKALLNEKLKSFREPSPGGEVPDAEMMGGGVDELEEYKREKQKEQRKKSEREVRREEIERVRREEVEERRRRWKEKEEGTVEGLKELVRQRFGG